MKGLTEKQIEQLNEAGKAGAAAGEAFATAVKVILKSLKSHWMPISSAVKNTITEDTIILFDTGEVRRFGENDHPISIITHYINL